MAINIVNSSDEKQHTKSHAVLVVTAITAALLFSSTIVSGLFPGSRVVLDIGTHRAFAQQQNQTGAATAGNNTNTTIAAASTYNEMLNPRQKEYPAHLGFNDLHIEAIRHIDPNATCVQRQINQNKTSLIS